MQNKTSYYKIGLFTVLSIALIVCFIIFLGVSTLFKTQIIAETYFNESVQGLNIGSPVKYRGVNVGKVTKIGMVNELYGADGRPMPGQEGRYIYVQFSLTPQLAHSQHSTEDLQQLVNAYIQSGLRTTLATQDLVGNVFLSLNFVDDPKVAPLLPIAWTPEHIYIPSTPSTLSQLTDSISSIASNLNQIDFNKVANDFDMAMLQVNTLAIKANQLINNEGKVWSDTFANLQQMSNNLNQMSNTLKNNPSAAVFGQPTQPVDPSK